MAKKPKAPTPYALLGQRIQRVINAPKAQSNQRVEIARLPDESPDDWGRLIEELETLEHVTLTPLEDGAMRLVWNPEESMA
ncbi:DUF1654 domain-containing protein [Halomonas korlensis]|uniref:DUF1654 domain-containing protein n=1 Tax=Halomonas korlensis TaxID=463301 RepID=A0A1I7GJK8_9GAMM|nr:DUF1654 domain-containing protein [Halomonas korlensis]SFU48620.1 Protein of unknown function [Halomonas korlensis]